MSEIEKTCSNCKYEHEDIEGTHCRHCIHNAEEFFEPKEEEQPTIRLTVKKRIVYDMGDKEVYCPQCNIKLYDSFGFKDYMRNQGVFDLANAKFCPKCGVEFE